MDEITLKAELKELKSDIAKHGYVYARASGNSLLDSVKSANRSKSWYYDLPKAEQERLETLASELAALPKIKAMQTLEDEAEKAAKVLARELDSRDAKLRVDVAKDVLDRNGIGKQTQKVDIDAKLSVEFVNDWRVIENNPTLPA